ncbi:MAG: peptide synthetase [Microbacterium sp.]|nr:peptide synthetase [Microbacterium sp.]
MLPHAFRVAGVVFAAVLGGILVLAVAAAAWIGVRGLAAYGHLSDAQTAAALARDSLTDPATAADTVAVIGEDTAQARELTTDPIWRAAEALPWVGPQLAAVSTMTVAVDDVAGSALTPLVEVAGTFDVDALRPQDGRLDLAPFTTIQDAAAMSAAELVDATAAVATIDRDALLPPVRDAVGDLSALLTETRDGAGAVARATALLPAMLGADGPRTYLLLFQNNAEWRSLGGITGAVAAIHTDDGALSLSAQGSSSDFPRYDDAVLPLDDEVLGIYGTRPGRYIQNVTQVPDFAISGALAQEMWERETGETVDGVIAVDPVALSYLLEATGPVTLPTGDELTAENAVDLLLNEVYFRYEIPAEQDAFFAAAAAAVFQAVADGDGDPAALLSALTRAGDEHRLLLWSAHEEDQALLADTTLAGGLPPTDDDTARFGVFLNDGTGSKMDYYVTAETAIGWDTCMVDEAGAAQGEATVSVTLTNTAPDAPLPDYITGGGGFGVPAGTARTVGYLYLPEGWELIDAEIDGDVGFGGGTHDGRRVLTFELDLESGEQASVFVTARTPEPGARTVEAVSTPRIGETTEVVATCPRA